MTNGNTSTQPLPKKSNWLIIALQWLVLTNLGRFALFFIIMLTGFFFSENDIVDPNSFLYTLCCWMGWIGVAGIGIQALIFIIYAWIINPLRDRVKQ